MDVGSPMERGEHKPLNEPLLDQSSSWSYQDDDAQLESPFPPHLKHKPFDWRAPGIILAFEFLESIAYSGIALNLVVYLTTVLHSDNASSAANVDTWTGTTFLAPLLGAFLADTYLGNYKTIAISLILYLLGMIVITSSAIIPSLRPSPCNGSSCPPASGLQYIVLFCALYLVALGTGGVKSALLPFGADQYDELNPVENQKKQFFFSWFFVAVNLGVFTAGTVIAWVQQNMDWALGFGLAGSCLILASIGFFVGTPIYRVRTPSGSPLKSVVKVVIASMKKMKVETPSDGALLYEEEDEKLASLGQHRLARTEEFKCLDKAAIITDPAADPKDSSGENPSSSWLLCTVTQVEEVKILLRMLPIWATGILYSAACCQLTTTFIQQGNAMDTAVFGSFAIPATSLNSVEVIFMMVWVVIHDKIVIPIARKRLGNPAGLSQLQRMGVGRFLLIPSMAAAAIIEAWRLKSVGAGHTLSIAWQMPQYLILAGSDVFCGIAQLEFFYGEAPETMRSMCSALSFLAISLGNYVNSLIITIVSAITRTGGRPGWIPAGDLNRGHLDYYFWLITAMSAVNFVVYVVFARNYTCKKVVVQG
ncbi:protein NRT1/ PTR FAMILY 8.3-like isoform X2 [Ananas comosus]|uniref:Protein NRT1/ PTR FAMILY 8.3-like isoform X2 n=1 Tax=Ananas comosus TaxID=4615 RepID=A0A6P5FN51_ANACO|nr:protein NRT1/ PTR FAMILY 8.3-like isoform X2 [Ananas comosus]